MSVPFSGRDLFAALSVVVIWGLNFVAMKWALADFTPFQLGVWRYVFAALPLVLIVRRPDVPWRWIVAYGLCQGVGQFGVLFIALQVGMTAALASVLMQTQVFFTALLGVVLLGEQLSRPLKWGLVWAAIGLGCFAMNYLGGAAAAGTTLLGFVLNLVSAAMWASSNIVARRTQQVAGSYDALGFVVWSAVVPIVPFVLLSLAFDAPALRWQWIDAPLSSWLAVAYLGWCATIMAYALWTGLLKRHPASRVAPFSLGVPVIGLAAGMGLLGEQVSPWQWAGGACIVMALLVVLVSARWQARR
ncbi:EamA family transporter [Pantoea sp. 18069]|uniref:EamA family transporter n=1 Tax=Pantoea sp. 18069 TaxID=2681415 RepID=UPI001359CFCB|nr:EamA family transporter [Pantoea sp. 18069]